uniref:BH3-interacting domain death agonist n=1 Tax=Sphenodon punctatus TaxID=8508 RepID=A0A8D0GVA8_SPHPU
MDQGIQHSASSILVYSFLQSSSDCTFRKELESLWASSPVYLKTCCLSDSDDLDDGELQTDGNQTGRLWNGEPDSGSVVDEEIFRVIGAQLAEMGDRLAGEIQPTVISELVRQLANQNLSREEITRHLSRAVKGLAVTVPLDMEQEKAMVLLAMILAKQVANKVPSLLRRVFNATVSYINHNHRDYVTHLAEQS